MKVLERINTLCALGNELNGMNEDEFLSLSSAVKFENSWFTSDNLKICLNSWIKLLSKDSLQEWVLNYSIESTIPKKIGIIAAGNIPMVCFHDIICVYLSGNIAHVKLSKDDTVLLKFILSKLIKIDSTITQFIIFQERLSDYDAVIATGSNNSARYFHYYFGTHPHIIRKNRTSCAVLDGNETESDFDLLALDLFTYYGFGCRNVSKLFVPEHYDFIPLLRKYEPFSNLNDQHKYANNYEYQRGIYLINMLPFFDNGAFLLREHSSLFAPKGVIYYETYQSIEELNSKLAVLDSDIQCIVSKINTVTNAIPLGTSQSPELGDYADKVDTIKFLLEL